MEKMKYAKNQLEHYACAANNDGDITTIGNCILYPENIPSHTIIRRNLPP
jgi:hypothetical protein